MIVTEEKSQDVRHTNKGVEALWLVVPVHAQEVDRDASEHDGQPDTTDYGLRVQGEDKQEGPEEQVDNWPNQTDL